MTEVASEGLPSQDQSINFTPEPQSTVTPVETPSERTFRQSEVGSIVNRARREEREKLQREYEAKSTIQTPQQSAPEAAKALDIEAIKKEAADSTRQTMQQEREKMEAERIANEFNSKMDKGKDKYKDFDEKIGDLNLQGMLPAIHWANSMDNTADIMYEFADKPEKLAVIMNLANTGQGQLAYKKLQALSSSIKANQAAKDQTQPRAPLSQLNSSNVAPDNGDNLDVASLQKQPWLRG
jgi:hypothetical protein